MHELHVECGPSSFCIPELLSNGTALKGGVLAFHHVVSVDTMRCRCLQFQRYLGYMM